MKKNIKTKSVELFKEFSQKNNYGVFNDSFMSIRYSIRKPKTNTEKITDYYFEDLITSGIDKVSNWDKFFEFVKFSLDSGNSEIAISQLIKKTPKVNNYEYDNYVSTVIDFLRPYKKIMFEYVARPILLENSWENLDVVFKVIDDQERRIAIFEAMFQTKAFENIDVQKKIYKLYNSNIKFKEKLSDYFTKIKKLDEQENVFDYIKEERVIVIGYNPEKIGNANLKSELSANGLIEDVKRFSKVLKEKEDLGISSILFEESKKNNIYKMYIVCNEESVEINKKIFKELFNKISRFETMKETQELYENIDLLIKEVKSECFSEKLEKELSSKQKVSLIKNKI